MILSSRHPWDTIPTFRRPWIVGHRGASDVAPENTQSAIEAAIASGCDGVEFDVQLTRDRIPVLYHDRTLHKINGKLKRISSVDLRYLQKLDWGKWFSAAYAGERLLPLADLLRDYASKTRLFIEIKSRSVDRRNGRTLKLTEIVVDMVRAMVPLEFRDRLFFLSFDREVLTHAHQLESEWAYVWNADKEDANAIPEFACAICVPVKRLTPELVQDIHRVNKLVMTYTCNTPSQANDALDADVDVLITDRPAWLVEHLNLG